MQRRQRRNQEKGVNTVFITTAPAKLVVLVLKRESVIYLFATEPTVIPIIPPETNHGLFIMSC